MMMMNEPSWSIPISGLVIGRLPRYADHRQPILSFRFKLVSRQELIHLAPGNSGFCTPYGLSIADVGLVILAGCVTAQLAEMGLELLFKQWDVE